MKKIFVAINVDEKLSTYLYHHFNRNQPKSENCEFCFHVLCRFYLDKFLFVRIVRVSFVFNPSEIFKAMNVIF